MLMNCPTMKVRLHVFMDLRVEQNMEKLNCLPERDVPMLKRKLSSLKSYMGGIKYMIGLPKIVTIVDQANYIYMAFQECAIFGSLTICLIDINGNPDLIDISILANKLQAN